jgi:predicted nucleic acid-binding protein
MIIISDTTPISNFIQIERLNILRLLYHEIIIPEKVVEELNAKFDFEGILTKNTWIKVGHLSKISEKLLAFKNLDSGELEAISLALESKANKLIIDEVNGRVVAKNLGLEIIGTLGILTEAKKKNLISNIKIEIEKLKEIDFWMSETLINSILKQANEI